MTVTPFPERGQRGNWADQLTDAIVTRDQIIKELAEGRATQEDLNAIEDILERGRLSLDALMSTIDARVTRTTGLRDITNIIAAHLLPANQTGSIQIIRTGPIVTLSLLDVSFNGSNWTAIGSIPQGFRPPGEVLDAVFAGSALSNLNSGALSVRITTSLTMFIAQGMRHRGLLTYHTTQPWPTTLPGTPA